MSIGYTHDRNWNNSTFASVNPANDDQLFFTVKQPMMNNILGYQDRRRITLTKLGVENASLDEQDAIEDIVAEVEKAYWQAAARSETVLIFEDMLEKAESLFETNKKSYDVGRIEKADFLSSEANVFSRRNDLERERVTYVNALATLKRLMNFDDGIAIKVLDKLEKRKPDVSFVKCLEIAIENRRDYKKAKRDININNISVQMTGNDLWPEIDVVSTLAMNGINSNLSTMTEKAKDSDNTYYYLGVEISVPLDNKEARGTYKKAKYSKEKSIVSLKNVERKIITDVGNAYREYMLYNTLLEQLIEVARLQKEKLEEETKQFNHGRSTTKKIIDYQREYLISSIEVVLGMYNYEKSRVVLEKKLNILLNKYEELL
jgi:outer membrane protein TolC